MISGTFCNSSSQGVTVVKKWRVPIQKENEASLGPKAKVEENGEEIYSSSSDSGVFGERHELS